MIRRRILDIREVSPADVQLLRSGRGMTAAGGASDMGDKRVRPADDGLAVPVAVRSRSISDDSLYLRAHRRLDCAFPSPLVGEGGRRPDEGFDFPRIAPPLPRGWRGSFRRMLGRLGDARDCARRIANRKRGKQDKRQIFTGSVTTRASTRRVTPVAATIHCQQRCPPDPNSERFPRPPPQHQPRVGRAARPRASHPSPP